MPDVPATCTMADYEWAAGGPVPDTLVACGETVIAVVRFACVHEHLDAAAVCAGCAADVQRESGLLLCPRCQDGPDPHDCRLRYEIRWASGEVTRG